MGKATHAAHRSSRRGASVGSVPLFRFPIPYSLFPYSSIHLAEHQVVGADHGHHVGEHVAAHDGVHGGEVGETGSTQVYAERLVGTVGNQIAPELALGRLDRAIGFAGRHAIAFGEQLEVMDERFHALLHHLAMGRHDLVVVEDHRAGIGAQPFHALADDAVGLAHLLHAAQVAVVAVAVDADGDVEVHLGIFRVRLLLAQVPFHAGAAQHHAGHAPLLGQFRADHTDADGALLPDAVGGEQCLVFVHLRGEVGGERVEEVEHRTFAPAVDALEV